VHSSRDWRDCQEKGPHVTLLAPSAAAWWTGPGWPSRRLRSGKT
jgi:hypothetical protein